MKTKKQTKLEKGLNKAFKKLTAPKKAKKAKAVLTKQVDKTNELDAKATENLDALNAAVKAAQAVLLEAETKAEAMRKEADMVVRNARGAYLTAIAPYKAACKKAGVECEFKGKRSPVSERVRFLIEKAENGGVTIEIKGRPETRETIDKKELNNSIMKAALAYTTRWIAAPEVCGAKHAGLYGRIRTVLGR